MLVMELKYILNKLIKARTVLVSFTATIITRDLSSTKTSVRCMALATCFGVAYRKGGKGLGARLL